MTNPILGTLTQETRDTIGVMDSAKTLIEGIGDRISAAVDRAIGNGATEEQLEPFIDLVQALAIARGALASAVAANPG